MVKCHCPGWWGTSCSTVAVKVRLRFTHPSAEHCAEFYEKTQGAMHCGSWECYFSAVLTCVGARDSHTYPMSAHNTHTAKLCFRTLAPLKVGMWLPGNDLIVLRRRHDSHIITTSWTSSLMKSLNDDALKPSEAPRFVTHLHVLTGTCTLCRGPTHEMIKLDINGKFALNCTSCHPHPVGLPHTFSPLRRCLLSLFLAPSPSSPPSSLHLALDFSRGCVSSIFWIFECLLVRWRQMKGTWLIPRLEFIGDPSPSWPQIFI